MWEGVGDRTELQHFDPNSIGHNRVSFPFSWAAQPGAWGPSLSGCWFSLPHLISNWSDLQTDWISSARSYIIVQYPPSSCGHHNFALIQPVHGQGYNTLIFLDRMHLLFTQVHFLFWQLDRVGGQYATIELVSKFHVAHCLSSKILHKNKYFVLCIFYLLLSYRFPFCTMNTHRHIDKHWTLLYRYVDGLAM